MRCFLLFICLAAGAVHAAPRVVATIAPLHSIVADVMQGVAKPDVLLRPGLSPHGYAMRPSELRLLYNADLVVWVGPELETFLMTSLESLPNEVKVLRLSDKDNIHTLPYRLETSSGDGDSHDMADDDAHDAHGGHDHGSESSDKPGVSSNIDPHIWLSPTNAIAIAEAVAGKLVAIDPDNADRYRHNLLLIKDRYRELEIQLRSQLAPHAAVTFMVFHDAYQYFERAMNLTGNVGALHDIIGITPGARRLQALRRTVRSKNVRCIFAEPQFPSNLMKTVAEGSDARIALVDPLGASTASGVGSYPVMMRIFSDDFSDCLAGENASE
ncbi:MAG: zinc ABC transporter substrate-binding protein [marine bacterium B5-7]|nr:MAG: zinc ABC transporter substrate-binding protein [marine bacterium B5-7]